MDRFALLSVGVAICAIATLAGIPAQAATDTGLIATPDQGVAGMAQVVGVVAPTHAGSSVQVDVTHGGVRQSLRVQVNRAGAGHVKWTPQTSGSWTVSAQDPDIRGAEVNVAAMPTFTHVAVPTHPSAHWETGLIATVESGDDSAHNSLGEPQGKVIFREVVRGVIGEAKVEPAADGTAKAMLFWVPPGVATYAVTAEFVPKATPGSTEAAYAPSSSPLAYMTAAEDPKNVQLLMPQVMRVGRPAYVAVKVRDHHHGSVSLNVDGKRVSLDKAVEGGMVHFSWVPRSPGLASVQAVFHQLGLEPATSSTQHGLISDLERLNFKNVVTQDVDVLEPRPHNAISVTPIVNGVAEEPWRDHQVAVYRAGTRVPLVTSSGNGSPVAFDIDGDCAIYGQTLLMPLAGGGCLVTARSPGGAHVDEGRLQVIVSSPIALRPTPTSATEAPGIS